MRLRSLCQRDDFVRLWVLLAIVVAMGLLEVAGIASILPFLQLAANPDAALSHPLLNRVYVAFDFATPQAMMWAIGWSVIVLITLSNILSALAGWQRQRIAWTIAHNISMKLVITYVKLPYSFFLQRDLADLVKSSIDDVNRVVHGVILSGCQFISFVIVSGMILLLLTLVQPLIAVIAVSIFGGVYTLIFFSRKTYLAKLGKRMLAANSRRYIAFVDLVSGIKTVKSDGAQAYFVSRFENPSSEFSQIQPKLFVSSSLPRYVVETIAFGAIVGVVLYLSRDQQLFTDFLPTLTLFALAGYRLMPAINGAYTSIAQVASSYPAINSIYKDIREYKEPQAASNTPLTFEVSLSLNNLVFYYSKDEQPALNNVNISILKGEKVAFVGPSGSGKTTLIDVVTGVLESASGSIVVDNVVVDSSRVADWQHLIGYVPQDVFLYNDTVAKNIAFGSEPIDHERVRRVCGIAQIDEHIETQLTSGYETEIGEHGIRLSGGQRQRLGLARALYRSPQILVLDEATSALDSATEGKVVSAIHDQLPGVTIIMIAHRISTVRRCDRLYLMSRGEVVAAGTYDEMLSGNQQFRELASSN